MVDGGWGECKNYTDVITCPIGQDRCAKAKAEAWLETRRTLTMSRVAPLTKNAKTTIVAE